VLAAAGQPRAKERGSGTDGAVRALAEAQARLHRQVRRPGRTQVGKGRSRQPLPRAASS
jgi:hypothetical protein